MQEFSLENSNEIPTFSLPKYNENFDKVRGITDESYWINLKILLKFLIRTYNYEYINIYKGKSSRR